MVADVSKFTFRPFAVVSVALFLVITAIAIIPKWRNSVRAMLSWSVGRQVLSTARAEFLNADLFVVAVKVKTPEGLFLEVYEDRTDGLHVLIDKVMLPYDRDGWIQFHGEHSNLILYDVTGDGLPEFLVPTFDPLRTPHLSDFNLDLETRSLRRESLSQDSLPF
jgi:hypothetical protein